MMATIFGDVTGLFSPPPLPHLYDGGGMTLRVRPRIKKLTQREKSNPQSFSEHKIR